MDAPIGTAPFAVRAYAKERLDQIVKEQNPTSAQRSLLTQMLSSESTITPKFNAAMKFPSVDLILYKVLCFVTGGKYREWAAEKLRSLDGFQWLRAALSPQPANTDAKPADRLSLEELCDELFLPFSGGIDLIDNQNTIAIKTPYEFIDLYVSEDFDPVEHQNMPKFDRPISFADIAVIFPKLKLRSASNVLNIKDSAKSRMDLWKAFFDKAAQLAKKNEKTAN